MLLEGKGEEGRRGKIYRIRDMRNEAHNFGDKFEESQWYLLVTREEQEPVIRHADVTSDGM
eukprot:scaffold3843_cov100-Skeletonema_marinoi.AAC.1